MEVLLSSCVSGNEPASSPTAVLNFIYVPSILLNSLSLLLFVRQSYCLMLKYTELKVYLLLSIPL
jgi:hypothetical protein